MAETEIGEGNTCQWVWMAQHRNEVISCIVRDQHGHRTGPRWWDLWTETRPSVSILTLPTSRCPVCWNGVWASKATHTIIGRLSQQKWLCILTVLTQVHHKVVPVCFWTGQFGTAGEASLFAAHSSALGWIFQVLDI